MDPLVKYAIPNQFICSHKTLTKTFAILESHTEN